MKKLFLLSFAFFFSGCTVHEVCEYDQPLVEIPNEYSGAKEGSAEIDNWWEAFDDPDLTKIMTTVLNENLDLAEIWDRVIQARANTYIQGAPRLPALDLNLNVTKTETDFSRPRSFATYLGGILLSYEVDFWRRIDSQARAACKEWAASYEDYEAAAFILSGIVADLYFTIQEQRALILLLEEQAEVNKTLLELVELRFSVGESSSLDVYQQRVQLAQIESQIPPAVSILHTANNQMQVLMGRPPDSALPTEPKALTLELPSFPFLGSPWDLLCRRPDVRAAQLRLTAADYEVAAAVAERFPKIRTPLSYERLGVGWSQLFENEILHLAADLLAPLFDNCLRQGEVERRKAIVCERLNTFGKVYLTALQEVEDALVQEKWQIELLKRLQHQEELSESNVREAKLHYVNGLDDYLTVIAAVQSLQNVQRQIVSERKQLLTFRANLYRSLGGSIFQECEEELL